MGKATERSLVAFGLALRTRRERLGISQEGLAAAAGLHRTYVGAVERGERNLTLLNIHALASAVRISPSQLIKDAEAIEATRERS